MSTKESNQNNITLPRIDGSATTNIEIQDNYIFKNLPFILYNAGVEEWRSFQEWRFDNDDGTSQIDFQHLISHFGQVTAPVYNNKSGHCLTLSVDEFLTTWYKYFMKNSSPPLRYMKDWHLVRDFPDYHAYDTPAPFTNDWLNDWWTHPGGRLKWAKENHLEHTNNDYRFCYMGCKGTYTPLHHDVMNSFSWSTNIIGKKLWRLFPPSETHKLYHHRFHDQLVEDTRDGMYDVKLFPNVKSAIYIDIVQNDGEIIFVPSGWHHQVHNLDDCISINHNWLNGCCIERVFEYVRGRWNATKNVISHLEDSMENNEFIECCCKIMGADTGLTPYEFFAMLTFWNERLNNELENGICASKEDDIDFHNIATKSKKLLLGVVTACHELWPFLNEKNF